MNLEFMTKPSVAGLRKEGPADPWRGRRRPAPRAAQGGAQVCHHGRHRRGCDESLQGTPEVQTFDLCIPVILSFDIQSLSRSACGDVLDTFETEKYKIIADDALKWLATYK